MDLGETKYIQKRGKPGVEFDQCPVVVLGESFLRDYDACKQDYAQDQEKDYRKTSEN